MRRVSGRYKIASMRLVEAGVKGCAIIGSAILRGMAMNEQSLVALEASIRRLKPGQSLRRLNDPALKIIFNTTDIIEGVEAAHNLAGRLACNFDYDVEQGIGIFRRKA